MCASPWKWLSHRTVDNNCNKQEIVHNWNRIHSELQDVYIIQVHTGSLNIQNVNLGKLGKFSSSLSTCHYKYY